MKASRICLLAILVIALSSVSLLGQNQYKDLEAQLKGLSNQAYARKAFSIAEERAKKNDMAGTLYFTDLAIDKAGKISESVVAALQLSKANILLAYGDQSDKINREIIYALRACHVADNKKVMNDEILDVSKSLNRILSDPTQIGLLHALVEELSMDSNVIREFKESTLAARQRKKIEAQLSSSEQEKKALLEDQEQIQATVRTLNRSKLKLDNELAVKTKEVANLAALTALQQAELERSMRIMDSLSFIAALDSMAIIQQDLIYDMQLETLNAEREKLSLMAAKNKSMQLSMFAMVAASMFLIFLYFLSRRYNNQLKEKSVEIEKEKNRYQELLLNILPPAIAEELKVTGKVKAKYHDSATILFCDLVNFSAISKQLSSEQLVQDLDYCFAAFDRIVSKYNIEKIKTIGDAYMCIGGLPHQIKESEKNVIDAAIDMQGFLKQWNISRKKLELPEFNARIGIHTGPVIAGVVGEKKFAYDVWGDSVNIAARMEANSQAGMINISKSTYDKVHKHFKFIKRGNIHIKNMNEMEMYFVNA